MRLPKIDYEMRYNRLSRLSRWLRRRYGDVTMPTLIRIDDRQRTFRLLAELAGIEFR